MGIFRNNNKILKQNCKSTIGNGLKFDGVSDDVLIPNVGLTTNYANSFSIACIVKKKALGNTWLLITSGNNNPVKGVYSYLTNSGVDFVLFTTGERGVFWRIVYNFVIGNVYDLVISYQNGVCVFYVDGVLISNSESATMFGGYSVSDNTTSLTSHTIGGNHLSTVPFFTNQEFYDFKIFNKALTPDEVTTLYNSNNNLIPVTAYPNLVANYTFNQKQGTSLIDSSGNSLNGTLINYAGGDVTLGVTNSWVDENGNPILV